MEETYDFQCTCCGDCCTGDMKININLYDLYKLALRFDMDNTSELFSKGLIRLVKVQNDVWTPQIIFKKEPFVFCPWLINDLGEDDVLRGFCSLHPHDKPLICKMAPAGRIVDFPSGDVEYVLTTPTENCPGMQLKNSHSLEELKKTLKVELDYEYRFYRLLEEKTLIAMDRDSMEKKFYSISLSVSFESHLLELERIFLT